MSAWRPTLRQLLVLLALAPQLAQGSLCIGSNKGRCNIVKDKEIGAVFGSQPGQSDEGKSIFTVGEETPTFTFYVEETSSGGLPKPSLDLLAAEPIAEPEVYSNFTGVEQLPKGTLGEAVVTFNCKQPGSTVVFITLAFHGKGSTEQRQFAVKKFCAATRASQDEQEFVGLDIATVDGMAHVTQGDVEVKTMLKPDVVMNGHVMDSFVLGASEDGVSTLYQVGEETLFTEFFLEANKKALSDIKFGEPSVLAEASICRPRLSGRGVNGGTLVRKNDKDAVAKAMDLTLTYNCRAKGTSPITVRVPIEPDGAVTFSVAKTCREDAEIGVTQAVAEYVSVPGLSVVRGDTGAEMIKDGLPLDAFLEANALTAPPAQVAPQQDRFEAKLVMRKSGDGVATQALERPMVFLDDELVLAATVERFPLQATQQPTQPLVIKFLCKATGSSRVIVRVPLSPAVGELTFALNKICDPTKEEAQRNQEAAKQLQQKSLPVDIKSHPDADAPADVVDAGRVLPIYSVPGLYKKYSPDMTAFYNQFGPVLQAVSPECRECVPGTGGAAKSVVYLKASIVKCNVTKQCTPMETAKLELESKNLIAHALNIVQGEGVYEHGIFSTDFYISMSPGSGVGQIGDPEVIALDDAVAVPKLLGTAAAAGQITETPSRIGLAFGCAGTGGATIVAVKVPLLAPVPGMLTFAVLKQCAAVNATFFGGSVGDNSEMANELEQVVENSGAGLNVGTQLTAVSDGVGPTDVVENGLVMPEFLPASNAANDDAGGYLVPSDKSEMSFWITNAEAAGTAAMQIGVPQVVSFKPRICKVSVIEESKTHKKQALRGRFDLAEPLDLQINFHCLKTGIAVIGVAIPLNKRGEGIHFEFAKECTVESDVTEEYKGDVLKGLTVGTAPGAQDVVKDGQVAYRFSRYKKERGAGVRKMIKPETREFTFFLSMQSADGLTTLNYHPPVVVAHKPICTPEVVGPAWNASGLLTKQELAMTITFHCVWSGQTPVTILLPLPGSKGKDGKNEHIVWTVTKKCSPVTPAESNGDGGLGLTVNGIDLTDHDGDGVVGPEYLEWMDWYDDYYDKPYKEDYWNTEAVPQEWGWTDEYWWYDEQYDYDYGEFDDEWGYDYYAEYDEDPLVAAMRDRGWENTHKLNVGTHPNLRDVVKEGVAQKRYKLCETDGKESCSLQALSSSDLTQFYISSSDFETLGKPTVRVKYDRSVQASILNADALEGTVVEPGVPVEIQVQMTCLKRGVTTPVLISLSYGYGLHHADFSVVRVCGKEFSTAKVAFETTTLLIALGIVMSMVLSFIAGRRLKKLADGRDLSQ